MSIMQSGVVEVKLTRGLVTIIDAEDLELVTQFKWCAIPSRNTHYAVRGRGKTHLILHRFLLDAPDGMQVDHKNSNGLDNRRENLRLCTPGENQRNKLKKKGCSSNFKGVSKRAGGSPKCWMASIQINRKIHCRSFATELEAALCYDAMAREHFGEFAKLNFP